MATNPDAAVRKYIKNFPVAKGDAVSVKERGAGDWEEYEIR